MKPTIEHAIKATLDHIKENTVTPVVTSLKRKASGFIPRSERCHL
jgi:hypothetical protein